MKKFIALTDARSGNNGNNGKSAFMALMNKFYGDGYTFDCGTSSSARVRTKGTGTRHLT